MKYAHTFVWSQASTPTFKKITPPLKILWKKNLKFSQDRVNDIYGFNYFGKMSWILWLYVYPCCMESSCHGNHIRKITTHVIHLVIVTNQSSFVVCSLLFRSSLAGSSINSSQTELSPSESSSFSLESFLRVCPNNQPHIQAVVKVTEGERAEPPYYSF